MRRQKRTMSKCKQKDDTVTPPTLRYCFLENEVIRNCSKMGTENERNTQCSRVCQSEANLKETNDELQKLAWTTPDTFLHSAQRIHIPILTSLFVSYVHFILLQS